MNSLTEENYLKAIYKLTEKEGEAVSTNALAEEMSTKAGTVSEMLKKLSDKKLINYRKYQGVTLTAQGRKVALTIIRRHRLWESFLVNKLDFKWDEVHDIAEQLEHINSDKLVEQLDKFLGFPKFDPHGDPIPDAHGKFSQPKSQLLSSLPVNTTCIMTGVVDHTAPFLQYLEKIGLTLGNEIRIKDVVEYDRSLHISINKKTPLYISHEVAKNILVIPHEKSSK